MAIFVKIWHARYYGHETTKMTIIHTRSVLSLPFFNSKDIIPYEYLPPVNTIFYKEVLKSLLNWVQHKLYQSKNLVFLHNNFPAHIETFVNSFLACRQESLRWLPQTIWYCLNSVTVSDDIPTIENRLTREIIAISF